jgi:hypothetical protein
MVSASQSRRPRIRKRVVAYYALGGIVGPLVDFLYLSFTTLAGVSGGEIARVSILATFPTWWLMWLGMGAKTVLDNVLVGFAVIATNMAIFGLVGVVSETLSGRGRLMRISCVILAYGMLYGVSMLGYLVFIVYFA